MCQAHTCGRVLARARVQVLQNSGSRMVVLRFTIVSARDRHWRNPRKKKLCNTKARVSVHWQAQCHAKWQSSGRAFQCSSGTEPKSPDSLRPGLTTKPLVRINCRKKTVHDSSYFATFNWFFGSQDCRAWIFQGQYQGQTRNTRILERKPLINTSYRIRHRLELKYFHFTQFLLIAHRAAHLPWNSENW